MSTKKEKKFFRLIVAGGRDFNDFKLLKSRLDFLLKEKIKQGYDIIIVSGKARGADKLGEKYANLRNFKVAPFPADWDKYGKAAGYRRNVEMAQNADACVVFWDKQSKGSKHMIDIAKKHNLNLRIIYYK